jgi:chromosome segregation ATPase
VAAAIRDVREEGRLEGVAHANGRIHVLEIERDRFSLEVTALRAQLATANAELAEARENTKGAEAELTLTTAALRASRAREEALRGALRRALKAGYARGLEDAARVAVSAENACVTMTGGKSTAAFIAKAIRALQEGGK